MAYPKPLSAKSLARLYEQAGIDDQKSEYLHKAFLACSNLYGMVLLRAVWNLLRENGAPLKRKDVINFSGIVRREDQPYRVYEVDELFCDEKRSDLNRVIVNKRMIGHGYGHLSRVYYFEENCPEIPYYNPQDLLAWAEPTMIPQTLRAAGFSERPEGHRGRGRDALRASLSQRAPRPAPRRVFPAVL